VLGSDCADNQPKRAAYLTAEIVFFYILYILVGVFIAFFPKMAYELAFSSWKKRENKRQAAAKERAEAKAARRAEKKAAAEQRAREREEE